MAKTIFAVIATNQPDALQQAIAGAYPNDWMQLAPGQWLVAAQGTAQEVSNAIGVTAADRPAIGTALVIAFTGYFGRQPSNVWEWIKAKWGSA